MKKIKQLTAVLLCALLLFSMLSVSAYAAVKPGKASGLTAGSITANSVTLSWKAGSNVSGYRIYYKSGGGWNVFKDVNVTSYTVTGLYASNTYTFAVRSYRIESGKMIYSDGYPVVSARTKGLVATKLTSKASVNSVNLYWDSVPGAVGYVVYQHKNGKWQSIGTPAATRTSGTVSNLSHNTSYLFAIRPYTKVAGKVVYGAISNLLSVKTLDGNKINAEITGVNASAVGLKWSKAVDASGYAVCVNSNGSWKLVKTVYSRDTLNCIISNLSSDTSYQFRIRPFKKAGAALKWYEWSNICSVITNPSAKDLNVYRTANLKNIFEAQSFTFIYRVTDKKYGNVPVTLSKYGDSYLLTSKVNELEYSLLNNEDGTYIILKEKAVYIKVPKLFSAPFDVSSAVADLLPGENWSGKATIESFGGKTVVCESFTNPMRTATLKYYYKAGELLGINEYGINGAFKESATVTYLKNGANAYNFIVPYGYTDVLYPETSPESESTADEFI